MPGIEPGSPDPQSSPEEHSHMVSLQDILTSGLLICDTVHIPQDHSKYFNTPEWIHGILVLACLLQNKICLRNTDVPVATKSGKISKSYKMNLQPKLGAWPPKLLNIALYMQVGRNYRQTDDSITKCPPAYLSGWGIKTESWTYPWTIKRWLFALKI